MASYYSTFITGTQGIVKAVLRKVLKNPELLADIEAKKLKSIKSFRAIASQENQITSISKQLLREIETSLFQKIGLKVNRSLPDTEVWFLARNEGYGLVGIKSYKKI